MQPLTELSDIARQALNNLQTLCPMRCQQFTFSERSYTIWTACDIDPLLNALVEKEDTHPDILDERMPYWAELWPSSLLMAQTILDHRKSLPSGRWLEIGCGPGLPGVIAASMGLEGTFSDYMQEALWLATLNAHQNNCANRVRFENLDWRKPSGDQTYSWILAGDVAYEDRYFDALLSTFEYYLEPGGEVWLGEPGRSVAKSFFNHMASEGWILKTLRQKDDTKIYKITKPNAID